MILHGHINFNFSEIIRGLGLKLTRDSDNYLSHYSVSSTSYRYLFRRAKGNFLQHLGTNFRHVRHWFRCGPKQRLTSFAAFTTVIFADTDDMPLTRFKSIPCRAAEVTWAFLKNLRVSNAHVNGRCQFPMELCWIGPAKSMQSPRVSIKIHS